MSDRQHTNILQAVSFSVSGIQVIEKRPDFLRAARGQRHHSKTVIVQKFDRKDGAGIRVGFTCSKKVGKRRAAQSGQTAIAGGRTDDTGAKRSIGVRLRFNRQTRHHS